MGAGGGRAGRAPSPCSSIKSIPRSEKQQQKQEKQTERRSVTPTRCPWSCEPARWWTFPLCTFDCFQTRAPVKRGKTSENQEKEKHIIKQNEWQWEYKWKKSNKQLRFISQWLICAHFTFLLYRCIFVTITGASYRLTCSAGTADVN